MKIPSFIFGTVAAACVMGAALPQPASAQVSADDFNALKKVVEQLGEKVQKLEQTHEQDQKTHEQDQQVIQQLQQQLGETKTAVTNAQQTADSVARAQAANPAVNASPGPLHNVTMVGDAEVQFGKTSGQHGAFTLADFAPVFLYRASDDVLFEAGFDIMNNNNAGPPRAPGYSTSVNLTFATLDYLLNDYMTLEAGQMLLPWALTANGAPDGSTKFQTIRWCAMIFCRRLERACSCAGPSRLESPGRWSPIPFTGSTDRPPGPALRPPPATLILPAM